ncbi:STP1 protein [Plasmodium ovale]|uniref:STP1 protein n=1 Tax=Plasmodium ovale TaxID=36330 RepID=A0A1C3KH61_PLAOA|nr:STP1 protein [Plasmodium ovale]
MAGDSGYSIYTRYITPEFFISMIASDIKELIHTYGHKNCGLRQEELCDKIKKLIPEKKKIVFQYMDSPGKRKWNNDWDRERSKYFDKLYKEEGFINMCFPKTYPKKNQSLDQLLSRHIQFCKKKDQRRAAIGESREYSVCLEYNKWIETQKKSFQQEYLSNVRDFRAPTVNKYFSTKEHPGGHDPVKTYLNSKLDCNQYNPPTRSHPKRPVAKVPTSSQYPPTSLDVKKGSKEKSGRSVPGVGNGGTKTESDASVLLKPKSPTVDFQIPTRTKAQPDGTAIDQDAAVKTKVLASPVNVKDSKKESTPIPDQPPTGIPPTVQAKVTPSKDLTLSPVVQHSPSQTETTFLSSSLSPANDTTSSLTLTTDSSINSGSLSSADQRPPSLVTKNQDREAKSTTSSDTFAIKHSTEILPSPSSAVLSLPQPQPPALNTHPDVTASQGPRTPPSSSASTATTTTTSPAAVTSPTISTTHVPISSAKEVTMASSSQEPSPPSATIEPKATAPATATDSQQTVINDPTPLSVSNNGGVLVPTKPVTDDRSIQTSLSSETKSKHKDRRNEPVPQLPNIITQTSEQKPDKAVVATDVKLPKTIDQTDTMHNISRDQIVISKDPDQLNLQVDTNQGKILNVKPGKDLVNNPVAPKEKNDNPNIIPDEIPSLTHIIPTLLVILATITLFYQLYKYTPFGFLLGRRRKRRKRDLRSKFVIHEESTYESPNIALHEWKGHNLVEQTVENDVYIKLLKINRYKQEMQKKKKKKKKTLIEVHMEVLEEYKNEEWELHKGDFLEICLRGFINDENETYQKLPYSKLTINNIKNEKTIEDIQKQEILWNNWIENHRNILEQWKKEEWFHILKNKWRNEEQKYKEKNDKLQENTLNEQETHSIVSQKDIWKQWISKQAPLIKMFNQEDWFKELVDEQNTEKNNYHINEYNNISLTNKTELKNEKTNHEEDRSKNIIQKLMVQIHMMVLEECIKEDIIKNKESSIDNFIQDIHTQNNYDEKRNMPQSDIDNFKVPEFEEIHTSTNK